MLSLYNTATKQKEKFIPLKEKKVSLYVCGMTVYDRCHLGHARVWVIFDILIRYFKAKQFDVHYVRNITDVDDKIIQRAQQSNQTIQALTTEMIEIMHADMRALQLISPTQEPRATDYIPAMIEFIANLIKAGYAYVTSSQNVYFSTKEFSTYGNFSHQPLKSLISGARKAVDTNKKYPLDFVLWKQTQEKENSWLSPWGWGRPGWHIECSTMALQCLGDSFDIHGGGIDLLFPHHQNEIAQSEAITKKPFAKTWMHVGFVQINQEKMSKSTGNALRIQELRQGYSGEIIRYFLLSSHYRSPMEYTPEHIQNAEKALRRLYRALHATQTLQATVPSAEKALTKTYEKSFYHALEDDLNTPVALSVLFDITHQIHVSSTAIQKKLLSQLLKQLGNTLGLLYQSPNDFLHKESTFDQITWIEKQIERRTHARQEKQWQLSDKIRLSLLEKGIAVQDTATETHWWRL